MSAASLLTPEQAIRRMQSRARWSTMQGSGQPRPALPCQRRGLQLQSGMRRWRPSAGCVGVNKGAQAGSGGGRKRHWMAARPSQLIRASRTSTAASEWWSCWRRRRGSWEQVPGKRSWPIVSQNRTSWKTQGRGLRSHVSRAPKRRQKLAWERSPHGFLAPGNRREPGGDLGFQSNL